MRVIIFVAHVVRCVIQLITVQVEEPMKGFAFLMIDGILGISSREAKALIYG